VPWQRRARVALFAAVGASLAVLVAARVDAVVGPFDCTATVRPSLHGATSLRLPPLGSIELDTHTGPLAIELQVDELRAEDAERFAANPELIEGLGDELAEDARDALAELASRAAVAALVGGVLGALAARFDWRSAVTGAAVTAVLVGVVAGGAVASFRPEAVSEPRYTGLLTAAPQAVGDVQALIDRFDDYRSQLTQLVGNVVTLYQAAEDLPSLEVRDDAIRALHISDIHNNPQGFDLAEQLVDQFEVDVVVDTGDLTDWGTAPESQLLDRIGDLGVPYVYTRGNHDSKQTQRAVAAQPNAVVLDESAANVAGLRFWGAGDPRYTPDKDGPTGHDVEAAQIEAFAVEVEESLTRASPGSVDVAVFHDARAAAHIGDLVPLVLAGHMHVAEEDRVDDALLLVEGSTGGAGLRGLEGHRPEPLTSTVLYFDPVDARLLAYDRITVDGFGGTGVRIERHVVEVDEVSSPARAEGPGG
jgi:predicted phosphodiesterase